VIAELLPDGLTFDIIYLGEIADLKKITRNDGHRNRFDGVRSQLLNAGKRVLSDVLLDTLRRSGRKSSEAITIGGALCTPDISLDLPLLGNSRSERRSEADTGQHDDQPLIPVSVCTIRMASCF
jgi:hypothetical protein